MTQPRAEKEMEKLDRWLEGFASFRDWLANPRQVEGYFSELERCFGKAKVRRASFDEILRQTAELAAALPEVGSRLWETPEVRDLDFEIEVSRTAGRNIDLQLWENYVTGWSAVCMQEFKDFFTDTNRDTLDQIGTLLEELQRRIQDFESSADAAMPKRRQEFYKAIRHDPRVGAAAAFVIYLHLVRDTPLTRWLKSGDGDLVLEMLRQMKETPRIVVNPRIQHLSEPILAAIKDRIPPLSDFLENVTMFPLRSGTRGTTDPAAKAQNFRFESLNRRFHGLWGGMTTLDCLAGGLKDQESITALRFLVCALRYSQVQRVHHEDKYLGEIHFIPIRHRNGGARYASVEYFCPSFSKDVIWIDPRTSRFHRLPLHSVWLHETMLRTRTAWEGLVLSENSDFDNAQALKQVRGSTPYLRGESIGQADEFEVEDHGLDGVFSLARMDGMAAKYERRFIFDASGAEAGQLRVLADELGPG